ncbi:MULTISPECIES: oxidoreductase [unclassified Streptomyces]|uniref:oxidoreductase n=1 Tax=unclassified Streptomyces TaxID=2593676 RepID=UPI00081BBEB8|nr:MULTISPECIES: oxidoreductase [unclassified Streptomyces]MYX74171.1 SDR family NAD(P)-dependent oxidoreductase [Streptomyces sp. SID3915]SCD53455.1 NADP-dependent 3-hydroxy acid dehydrogenase YdfG [Streptomyces sp. BpilaLS-43]
MTTWFITGASRGFGREIARQALDRGDGVVATARNSEAVTRALPGYGDRLLALALDVTDEEQVRTAVAAAVEAFGTIDVLVNNAGRGLLGAVEEASDAAVRAVYDTNVFGLLAVSRAVLPVMRRQRSGRVLNFSSLGGFSSSAGFGIYCSTKFAVEGISEAMHAELAPLGIGVTLVEPGYFRTDFLDAGSLHTEDTVIADYAATSGAVRGAVPGLNHAQPGDPVKGAAAVLALADAGTPPVRAQLGSDCVAELERKIAQLREESAVWRHLALSTDHDDAPARVRSPGA